MRKQHHLAKLLTIGAAALGLAVTSLPAVAAGQGNQRSSGTPADYWTAERRAAAIPRDLVIDDRGYGYLQMPDGSLQPYGHNTPAAPLSAEPASHDQSTRKGPPSSGGDDTEAPAIGAVNPADGETIAGSHTFSAVVTDPGSGVKSVSFIVGRAGSSFTQTFSANGNGDTWSLTINGFNDGSWEWTVVAKDNAKRGGNTASTGPIGFTVDTGSGGGGGGGGGTTTNSLEWTAGGEVQQAAGRIYFTMPTNRGAKEWVGYVCSGTVVEDNTTGRSVILTAAHCVYDDANKYFARDVMFIPNQNATTGLDGTDLDCTNDPHGCWYPSLGVVDVDWTTRKFPNNVAWDYAYYVVNDKGAHAPADPDLALDTVGSLQISFSAPDIDVDATALGYSYADDPNFMYCEDPLENLDSVNYWLDTCALTGGSSGGPWVQPAGSADGPIISVNSWGYTNSDGMAGPKLAGSSASCLFNIALDTNLSGGDVASC